MYFGTMLDDVSYSLLVCKHILRACY